MSIAKVNKRKPKEDYIKYGFACPQKDGEYIPCVSCIKTLASSWLKPF